MGENEEMTDSSANERIYGVSNGLHEIFPRHGSGLFEVHPSSTEWKTAMQIDIKPGALNRSIIVLFVVSLIILIITALGLFISGVVGFNINLNFVFPVLIISSIGILFCVGSYKEN